MRSKNVNNAIKPEALKSQKLKERLETRNSSLAAPESSNFHTQLLDTIEQSVIAIDLSGSVIYWNQFAERLYGWSAEEAIGRSIMELTTPKPEFRQAEEIMSRLRLGESWTGEFTVRRKDGATFPAQIVNSPIYDDQQRLIGIVGLSSDITERKNAEQRLRQSEERLRNIFEASHDGILVEDNETIIYVNKSYLQMFGYACEEELIGQHVSVIIAGEDVERVTEFGRSRLRGEQSPTKYEFKGRRKDGTLVDVEASVSTSNVDDHVYITTMIRNITERKRAQMLIEAQKESLEMLIKGAPIYDVLTYLTQIVEQQSGGRAVASILLLDEGGRLHNGASPGLSEHYLSVIEGIKANENVGTCSSAAASGKIVVTPDIAADAKWGGLAHFVLEQGFKAAWTMPIIARDKRVLGTFGTYFRERREPTAIERQVVEILGRTAALAIEGKQMEEALRGNETQLRLITDAVPLLVSYVDKDHRYSFVNKTYSEWFGLASEEVVGRHLSEVLGNEAYLAILPEVERALSGEEVNLDLRIPYESGERFIHLNYIPEIDRATGQVDGFYAFVQDITERRRDQEALQRSREELESRVRERTRELEKANEARIQVLHQLVSIQEDERQRIARDLHDQLGQQLTALRLQLEVLKKMCGGSGSNGEFYQQVSETQKVAKQLDSDVDFLAWQMRPTALDDLGIAAALDHYVRQWSEHFNIPAHFDSKRFSKVSLSPDAETNLYRIAQEALNNVYKHARANSINVFLESHDDFAVLIIEDDGIGFEKDNQISTGDLARGMGLVGMSERAALIAGTLEIESVKGGGTTVYAKIPTLARRKEKK
jgi:PAS domain S-box-containing protein